jgi:8-hydroxy-5-deazaflavin:NADPH oxidoreductase
MTIGIIGSGNIGATVARLAVSAGHNVFISNSRGPASMASVVSFLGDKAKAGTVDDAIAAGDFVVVAIPFRERAGLFEDAARFRGKIVVDAMNPYSDSMEPMDLGGRGSAEVVAEELPGARVVKAFNTLRAAVFASSGRSRGAADRVALPIASDDADAKRVVASFIDSIGFDVLDVGSLEDGRKQEIGAPLYMKPMGLKQAQALVAQT